MVGPNRDLKQLYKRQTVLKVLTFTMATVFVWIGFSLFRSQKKTAITAEQKRLARPLTPDINEKVLQELEGKRHFNANELSSFPIYKLKVVDEKEKKETAEPASKSADLQELFLGLSSLLSSKSATASP